MCTISGVKHGGNFLNKNDPKFATLLQQADLLSSLATKVKTENTSQSMDEAWQVWHRQLDGQKFYTIDL
jgi:myb proto-oncogene protein